jgi:hypothetical protein
VTSLLNSSAVALLAHKRLEDVVDALDQKLGGQFVDDLVVGQSPIHKNAPEQWVLELARAARDAFEGGPKADGPHRLLVGPGAGRGISQYAILGSAGFELPAYAEVLQPGGTWVADAIRRGSPDPNLSKVVVGTTQFAVRTGELARARARDANERARIDAFAMGMLSSIAGAVALGPVLRGLQARRSKREWTRHAPAVDLSAAEARTLRNLLPLEQPARVWQGWWPPSHDVPDALYDGYIAALEEVYQLTGRRPQGFPAFEHAGFDAGEALTAKRLDEAYAFLRNDASTADWGWKGWWLVLSLGFLVTPLGLVIAHELPHAGKFFQSGDLDGTAVYELLVLGLGLSGAAPLGWSLWLWSMIPEHTGAFVSALVIGVIRGLVSGIGLKVDPTSLSGRLGVLGPLFLTDVYAFVQWLRSRSKPNPGDAFVFLLQATSTLGALALLVTAYVLHLLGVESTTEFVIGVIAVTVAVVLAAIPLARAVANRGGVRSWFLREQPDGLPLLSSLVASANPADPSALALVFDESTLWHEPGVAAPTLGDLRFPSGPRPLVRVWWTGNGDLEVNADDHTITFRPVGGNPTPVQIPVTGATAADLATRIKAAVAGLEAEPVDAADPLYDLPFPQSLADPGDTQASLADHDAHRGDFVPVGKTKDSAHLVLHTPRVELGTGIGLDGPTSSRLEDLAVVPSRTLADVESAAMGMAADLAALLCMGAMPSLVDTPIQIPAAPAPLAPVYQVFRQWNLDERRVNEWRMLVSGGADSEKGGNAGARDPAMRPNPVAAAPAYASANPGGEPLATAMGWIPLWRAWLRMASDPTADTNDQVAMPYTPVVATRDGNQFKPTNRQLTTAVRFLLDLP